MLQQRFVGGVLFDGDRVLLLHNDKREWVLPKGQLGRDSDSEVVLCDLLRHRLSLDARIVSAEIGETSYERYSVARKRPVQVNIVWSLLALQNPESVENLCLLEGNGYDQALFFSVDEALQQLTYPAERNLLLRAYQQLQADLQAAD